MLLSQVLERPNQEKEAVVAPVGEPSVTAGEGGAWVWLNSPKKAVHTPLQIPPLHQRLSV